MKALAAALVAAQAEMPNLTPDSQNPHYKSMFVSLSHLITETRPILNKNGIAIIQLPALWEGQPVLRTTLIHGPSGESIVADMPLILGRNDMQGLGAALTYAKRQAWTAALGIAGDEDNDGEPPPPPKPPKARSKAVSSPAPQPTPEEQAIVAELEEISTPAPITDAQMKKLMALFKEKGFTERAERHAFATVILGRQTTDSAGLTRDEASRLIDVLQKRPDGRTSAAAAVRRRGRAVRVTSELYPIKAKPAVYRGIQMRSTLEARTAVALDRIGLPVDSAHYEPARYVDETGMYTPDFGPFSIKVLGAPMTETDHLYVEGRPEQVSAGHRNKAEQDAGILAVSVPDAALIFVGLGEFKPAALAGWCFGVRDEPAFAVLGIQRDISTRTQQPCLFLDGYADAWWDGFFTREDC